MKLSKKQVILYVFLTLLGIVFGLNQIKNKTEDGYILKAEQEGRTESMYELTMEKGQTVSQEILMGKQTLDGFRVHFGEEQAGVCFDVTLKDAEGRIVEKWEDETEDALDERGYAYFYLDEMFTDVNGQVYTFSITDHTGGLRVQVYDQPNPDMGHSNIEGKALNFQAIYGRMDAFVIKLIFVLFCFVLNFFVVWLLNREKVSYVKLFVLLYGVLGAAYLAIIPFSMVPDESIHYFRAYEIANGNLISDITDEEGHAAYLISYPAEWENTVNHLITQYEVWEYTDLTECEENDAGRSFNATALYSPISYLPQSLGIAVAKIFTNKVWILFLVGRICNFVAIGAIMALAVHLIPYGKKYLILTALVPMNLHECISLAPDGMVTALVFLMIAFVLYLREQGEKTLKLPQLILLYVLAIVISLYKIVYLPFCLLYFLIPKEKFGKRKKYWANVAAMIVMVGIFLGSWMSVSSRYLYQFNPGVDSGRQVQFVLTHPFAYVETIINTLISKGTFYFNTMLGSLLGWLNVQINEMVLYTFVFVVIVALCRDYYKKEKMDKPLAGLSIFIIASTVLLILTSLYVEWTAVGEPIIEGVQGRYFIPLLPILFLAVIGRRSTETEVCKGDKLDMVLVSNLEICVLSILLMKFIP